MIMVIWLIYTSGKSTVDIVQKLFIWIKFGLEHIIAKLCGSTLTQLNYKPELQIIFNNPESIPPKNYQNHQA